MLKSAIAIVTKYSVRKSFQSSFFLYYEKIVDISTAIVIAVESTIEVFSCYN